MTQPHRYSRRLLLQGGGTTSLLLALGAAAPLTLAAQKGPQDVEPMPVQPALALSLTLLQQQLAELQRARRKVPDTLVHLEGMNRLQGLMTEPDGELLLLGSRDTAAPSLHLDDLVVALRHAYQVDAAYQGVPGCTIDPWVGANDPWRIQRVVVTGMPPHVPMAARHVAIDYALKKVSAGIMALTHDVTSLYALHRAANPLCGDRQGQHTAQPIIHRFWFYPRYPPTPRFMQEAHLVLILRPVEVQLLTEREFLSQTGQRQGSTVAAPAAQGFANAITQLLATTTHPDYTRLVQDFRCLELGQLLRFREVPAASVAYFLQDYPLTEVTVPAFVGGIRREEHGEVVCDTQITEQRLPQGTHVASTEHIKRYHYVSRGGVEARIRLTPTQFAPERAGALARLRQQVRASRPSARTLWWAIKP
jgi:hypothetical protein